MLERKIKNQLIDWKKDKNKMCLMIKGARQVGKTYIIREFAKESYKYFIEINFDLNEKYKEMFSEALDAETIMKQITLYFPEAEFIPGETIIFLDEIQNCPRAVTALKFLAKNERFDVIASRIVTTVLTIRTTRFQVYR